VLFYSPIIAIINLIVYAMEGVAMGALCGWLASLALKCGPRGLWRDALLGAFGYLAGLTGCALTPWPENTVTERLSSGVIVSTTMHRYQHPMRIAMIVALLLPLLHELYRFKQARKNNP
jgi:hypothetical protein